MRKENIYTWGYIGRDGEYVIPLQFQLAGDFRNCMARMMVQMEEQA